MSSTTNTSSSSGQPVTHIQRYQKTADPAADTGNSAAHTMIPTVDLSRPTTRRSRDRLIYSAFARMICANAAKDPNPDPVREAAPRPRISRPHCCRSYPITPPGQPRPAARGVPGYLPGARLRGRAPELSRAGPPADPARAPGRFRRGVPFPARRCPAGGHLRRAELRQRVIHPNHPGDRVLRCALARLLGAVAGRRAQLTGWALVASIAYGLFLGARILLLQALLQPGQASLQH